MLPEELEEQAAFFSPDLSAEKKKHREFLENQASLLRRFLVHRSPIMPVGILRFCLQYAAKDDKAPATPEPKTGKPKAPKTISGRATVATRDERMRAAVEANDFTAFQSAARAKRES